MPRPHHGRFLPVGSPPDTQATNPIGPEAAPPPTHIDTKTHWGRILGSADGRPGSSRVQSEADPRPAGEGDPDLPLRRRVTPFGWLEPVEAHHRTCHQDEREPPSRIAVPPHLQPPEAAQP